jgi:hypothetical protein
MPTFALNARLMPGSWCIGLRAGGGVIHRGGAVSGGEDLCYLGAERWDSCFGLSLGCLPRSRPFARPNFIPARRGRCGRRFGDLGALRSICTLSTPATGAGAAGQPGSSPGCGRGGGLPDGDRGSRVAKGAPLGPSAWPSPI